VVGVTYTIQDGVIILEFTGTYVSAEIIRQFLKAMNDPACPPEVALMADVSRSESLAGRPTDEIRMVAEFLGPYSDRIGGRCAVVAGGDAQFGLSQMGAVYTEGVGVQTRVFRTREAALEWLKGPR
jgi:hypothetical protein